DQLLASNPPSPPPPSSVSPSFKSILETTKNPTPASSLPNIPPINPPPPPPPGFNPNTDTFLPIDLSSFPEIHSEWENSIFLKVLGHSFSRDFLQKSLSQKWRLRKSDNLLSLGKGVYILKNLSQESFNLIQSRRPWTLENSDKLFTKVPVWIELPDLPVEFHANEPLRAIGNHLGSFIRMDTSELQRNNLRFARLLVEVESDAALPNFIWLGNIKQEIRHKNTPLLHARDNSMRPKASLHPQNKEALEEIRTISPEKSNWITVSKGKKTQKNPPPFFSLGKKNPP
ncbi:Speckle targeted PIP5K1A-regulated poly(A) polymerase, partial [Bienertia sinuspersici]